MSKRDWLNLAVWFLEGLVFALLIILTTSCDQRDPFEVAEMNRQEFEANANCRKVYSDGKRTLNVSGRDTGVALPVGNYQLCESKGEKSDE